MEIPEEDCFTRIQASSLTYRFATGPSKGKKALVIKIILNHLELPSTPPKLHPARGPPEADQYDFAQEFFEDYPQLDQ